MLSQLACVLPVYSTILISFHASRAFLSCWSTTGLRICDTEQGGRERGKKKMGREEFDPVAKFIARLCVKTSRKFLKLGEGMYLIGDVREN